MVFVSHVWWWKHSNIIFILDIFLHQALQSFSPCNVDFRSRTFLFLTILQEKRNCQRILGLPTITSNAQVSLLYSISREKTKREMRERRKTSCTYFFLISKSRIFCPFYRQLELWDWGFINHVHCYSEKCPQSPWIRTSIIIRRYLSWFGALTFHGL